MSIRYFARDTYIKTNMKENEYLLGTIINDQTAYYTGVFLINTYKIQ